MHSEQIQVTVLCNVSKSDGGMVTDLDKARQAAQEAIGEALDHAQGRGFNHSQEDTLCIGIDKVDDGKGDKIMIATGNPAEGFAFYGPFECSEDAIEWGEQNLDRDWWEVPLQSTVVQDARDIEILEPARPTAWMKISPAMDELVPADYKPEALYNLEFLFDCELNFAASPDPQPETFQEKEILKSVSILNWTDKAIEIETGDGSVYSNVLHEWVKIIEV